MAERVGIFVPEKILTHMGKLQCKVESPIKGFNCNGWLTGPINIFNGKVGSPFCWMTFVSLTVLLKFKRKIRCSLVGGTRLLF